MFSKHLGWKEYSSSKELVKELLGKETKTDDLTMQVWYEAIQKRKAAKGDLYADWGGIIREFTVCIHLNILN